MGRVDRTPYRFLPYNMKKIIEVVGFFLVSIASLVEDILSLLILCLLTGLVSYVLYCYVYLAFFYLVHTQ